MLTLNRRFLSCDDFPAIAPRALWLDGEDASDYAASRNYYEWYMTYPMRMSRRPSRMLEIGVRYGYSAVATIMGMFRRSRRVGYWGIDDASYGVDPIPQGDRIKSMFDAEAINTRIDRADTQSLGGLDSAMGRFDIIHLDGSHTHDGSGEVRDLELVLPLLAEGGIIVMDDVTDGRPTILGIAADAASRLGLNCVYAPTFRGHLLMFRGSFDEVMDVPPGSVENRIKEPTMVRDGTLDRYTHGEVILRNCYHLRDRVEGIRVVDVGAHVGYFCDLCLDRGAAFVDAYEANPETFAVGSRRMAGAENLRYRNIAVWSEPDVTVQIEMDDGVNTGSSSIMVGGSRIADVRTTTLDRISGEMDGPIDLLKMDCEGAEYPILYGSDLSMIGTIVGEFHPFTLDDAEATGAVKRLRDDLSDMLSLYDGWHLEGHLKGAGFKTWFHPGGLFAATRVDDPPVEFGFRK